MDKKSMLFFIGFLFIAMLYSAKNSYWLGSIKVTNKTGHIVNLDTEYLRKYQTGEPLVSSRASLSINPDETLSISLGKEIKNKSKSYTDQLRKIKATLLDKKNSAEGTFYGHFVPDNSYFIYLNPAKTVIAWINGSEAFLTDKEKVD